MDELKHYGVKGMHWGVRRYQNYDGTRIGATRRRQSGGGFDSVQKKKVSFKRFVSKGVNDKPIGSKVKDMIRDEHLKEQASDYATSKMKAKDYSKSSPEEIMNDWSKFKKEFYDKAKAEKNVKEKLSPTELRKLSDYESRFNRGDYGSAKEVREAQTIAKKYINHLEQERKNTSDGEMRDLIDMEIMELEEIMNLTPKESLSK